ncbi:hypothetical protein ACO0QE_002859 [Hanseniaspora vineae]
MNVTVINEISKSIYGPMEYSDDLTLENLQALLQFEAEYDEKRHELVYGQQVLDVVNDRNKTLKDLQIKDTSTITIRMKKLDPIEQLRLKLLDDVETPEILKSEILIDLKGFKQFIEFIKFSPISRSKPLAQVLRNNALMEELAYARKIDEQMTHAMEYTPENFTTVSMLYINMEINGHPVKAFVDSGAQNTIMSTKLAKLTKLDRMVDKRFQGEARGVGVSNIVGKIHSALVKIETQFVACSFTVLDINVDLLLGLDMLKRYQACIDLEKNVLKFAGIETPFLGEADIPKEPVLEKIAGADVNAGSGARGTAGQGFNANKRATPTQTKPASSVKQPKQEERTLLGVPEQFSESSIKTLMDLGFPREKVIEALKVANGNADLAASILLNM